MKVCRQNKVDCADLCKGKELEVSRTYFSAAQQTIFEIGLKLAHVFWRKIRPEERARADGSLISTSYDLLAEGRYRLAKTILDFATEVLKSHSSEESRLSLVINRAQAYKWSGETERTLTILDKEDFSALRDKFKLARAVLRDEHATAASLVRSMGPSGGVHLEDYRQWPLFKEFRKTEQMAQAVFDVFGESLHRQVEYKDRLPESPAE